ncbi:hypothetical protein [Lyngbya sp. CCAP 1446/10]|uniref:hypothetical protein n=1 Tax=Lyngbya sp. CCAP 1446/10 TaxID=439293 RepID=UPI0022388987|nr:hypothetical protein [Lyngbya sp. CCAP 1446/10]
MDRSSATDFVTDLTDRKITNYRFPITDSQLPIINYQLPITDRQLPIPDRLIVRF